MKTIVLTGGGTAGHCIPHLAIYPYIKNFFEKFYYIGSYDGIECEIMSKNFPYYAVTTAKLRRNFSTENFKILPKVLKGIKEAENILAKLQPDIIFSKGGYVAVPVIFAAKKLNIPVVAHESDYTMGLANKITAKKCKAVMTSFKSAGKRLNNAVFTGPPVRNFRLDKNYSLKYFGFNGSRPILLVLGGSSGSVTINNAINDLLPDLLAKYDILHICGSKHISNEKHKGYKQIGYLEDISLAYAACDFAVSRAGAGVCFELMNLNIPTLFIPLSKKASRGDQILNAEYFYRKNACNLLFEEDITKLNLINKIEETFSERNFYVNNILKIENLCGNEKIASIIKKYAL